MPVIGVKKIISGNAGLGANHPQGRSLDCSMCGYGQGCNSAVGIPPLHLNVLPVPDQFKTQFLQCADYLSFRRISRELRH